MDKRTKAWYILDVIKYFENIKLKYIKMYKKIIVCLFGISKIQYNIISYNFI